MAISVGARHHLGVAMGDQKAAKELFDAFDALAERIAKLEAAFVELHKRQEPPLPSIAFDALSVRMAHLEDLLLASDPIEPEQTVTDTEPAELEPKSFVTLGGPKVVTNPDNNLPPAE